MERMTLRFFKKLSQWPKLFHYGKTGNNLSKCLCFCTFLKTGFSQGWLSGLRQRGPDWLWGRGQSSRAVGFYSEVLYSLSRVSALCYCFSLFIKCVWITVEMLWLFFFPNKDSETGLRSLKSSLQPAALPAPHRYCILVEEMCRFDTCLWLQFTSNNHLPKGESNESLPRLLSGIKIQLKLVSDVFIYEIIANSTFILTISTDKHKQVEH